MVRSRHASLGALTSLLLLAAPLAVAGQVGNNLGLLEPNLSSRDELVALPHFDAALADAVIEGRPHLDMLSLNAVLGARLTPEQRTEVYGRLWTPLNLNTATAEEILLIPGLGERMLHEFEEYRPYVQLAQFRREMGKYVDEEEVARLEQYVFVPIDLNTAIDEAILSIPGLGERMLHEFKEYRPYTNIAQFQREIGKYVEEDEVARLERYVTIR